jgi:hypothetical protein
MHALWRFAIVAAGAGLVNMGCNGPSTRTRDQTDHGAAGKQSSVTGCLMRGDNGQSYILRAENEPQPQGNERPERPTSSAGVYRISADHSVDVSGSVGARVKVTAYLETVPVAATGDANGSIEPAATSGSKPQDERTDMIDMKILRVTAVEKIGSCS